MSFAFSLTIHWSLVYDMDHLSGFDANSKGKSSLASEGRFYSIMEWFDAQPGLLIKNIYKTYDLILA